jgi:hypothetical protein
MPLLSLEWLAETFPGVVHLQTRLAPRSLYEYRQDAQHYLTWCALDKDPLDPQTLRAWRRHMDEALKLNPKTINRRLVAIKTLVRASVACEALDERLAYRFGLVELVSLVPLRQRLRRRQAFTRTVKISKRTVSPTFMASPLIPLELEVQLDMAHTEALV